MVTAVLNRWLQSKNSSQNLKTLKFQILSLRSLVASPWSWQHPWYWTCSQVHLAMTLGSTKCGDRKSEPAFTGRATLSILSASVTKKNILPWIFSTQTRHLNCHFHLWFPSRLTMLLKALSNVSCISGTTKGDASVRQGWEAARWTLCSPRPGSSKAPTKDFYAAKDFFLWLLFWAKCIQPRKNGK